MFAIPQPDGLTVRRPHRPRPPNRCCPIRPEPTTEELAWLRERISAALAVPLRAEDVIGTYSGLRPLVSDAHAQTADISRKHLVARQPNGVIAVTGGKLTAYRKMAEDAVDLISGQPCPTAGIALVGASGRQPQPRPAHPSVRVGGRTAARGDRARPDNSGSMSTAPPRWRSRCSGLGKPKVR